MEKKIISKLLAIAFFVFLSSTIATAQQGMLYKVSLNDQVAESPQIIEGKVISKKSFWNANHDKIYTLNTIEVYKVFKGQKTQTIEVVTRGGTVGFNAQIVSSSLKLHIGDIGVFLLKSNTISFESKEYSKNVYTSFSSKQGFYKYNIQDDLVVNPFSKYKGITSSFYDELIGLTNKEYDEVQKVIIRKNDLKKNETNKSRFGITSISPTTSSAGTGSVLTIFGSGFGSTQGSGIVEFKWADDGGATFIQPLGSQINSWNDAMIKVQIPEDAGTGVVQVTPHGGSAMTSEILTVQYAELNGENDWGNGLGLQASSTRHVNRDGNGGYTWQMQTDFDANTSANESFMRAFNTWICETGVNWTIGAVTITDNATNDDINIIRFDNGNELDVGVLGQCISYLTVGCGIVDESADWYVEELDIVFNDSTNWEFGTGTPSFFEYDFESVAIHELGHGHQLGHVINTEAIMHWSIANGESIRTLDNNDKLGAGDVQARSEISYMDCGNPDVLFYSQMTSISCPTVGIEDQLLADGISIFPNPVSNRLFIQNNTFLRLQKAHIYDVSGRLLLEKDIGENSKLKTINIGNLSQGIYFINLTAEEGTTTKRFVVK